MKVEIKPSLALLFLVLLTTASGSTPRLLSEPSGLTLDAIRFDRITADQLGTALERGLEQARQRLAAIRENPGPPTFANTIEAIEQVSDSLEQANAVFSHYLSAKTEKPLQALAEEIKPEISRFSNSILFDAALFARVEAVYQARQGLGLDVEQMTLLENTYRAFVRNGAKLSPEQKQRVNEIDARLVVLSEKFKQNVNDETNAYALTITDPANLAGLPGKVVAAAAEQAKERGQEGAWVFTLEDPVYRPFITYADSAALREKLYQAYFARATTGGKSNRPILLEIAKLRLERARILGYETHAHYTLEERMAENPATVESFLTRLTNVYRPAAIRDLEELRAFAGRELKPWDILYFSEKLQEARYHFKSEELRPYFALDQVINGALFAASKLHGLSFVPRTDLPTWDPNVRAFEVRDRTGAALALFYLDPFRRESKRPGAWMTFVRKPGDFGGQILRPHVVNVGNFTRPVGKDPALLSLNEVTTLFHELGHGLHGMLTQARYHSLAGTNVAWDFVELPSQLNENWALEPEVLDVYARHYRTGERIPEELVTKVRRARTFQAGLLGLNQVRLAALDFAWHARDLSALRSAEDVADWEEKAKAPFMLIPGTAPSISTSFGHLFSGGYSAGYYSYKWAELIAADAFSVFQKEGVFNPAVAERYRREILERGGTEKAATLYRRFRGSDPDPDALLRKEGLLN